MSDLEKRVKALEDKLASFKNFGRAYSQVGDTNSDFLIKTKGQVKIQWGNKFIDLLKNGKLNVDSDFVFTSEGKKNGIYVINGNVYFQINEQKVQLGNTEGNTFISLLDNQNNTLEQKSKALKNIGLIYDDISEAKDITSGIVYIENEKKLYIGTKEGLKEYSIPTTLNSQFIIDSDSKNGSLVIIGEGRQHSIKFNNMYLYIYKNETYLDSMGKLHLRYNNSDILTLDRNGILISNKAECNLFQSIGANDESGFKLYNNEDGESTLKIDNLVLRNNTLDNSRNEIYPTYWYYKTNIISKIEGNQITLQYPNEFEDTYTLRAYTDKLEIVNFTIDSIDGATITVSTSNTYSGNLQGQVLFTILDGQKTTTLLKRDSNTLDLITPYNIETVDNTEMVTTRIGRLDNLNKQSVYNEVLNNVVGDGLYSNFALFNSVYLTDPLYNNLNTTEHSNKLICARWIHKLLPNGIIMQFKGYDIPDGWAICDGNNGTPDLSNRFETFIEDNGIDTYDIIYIIKIC